MSGLFARIVSGEIPCHKVLENDKFLAFLDIQPLRLGHVLVIPKQEVDYIFDLDDSLLSEMMTFSKSVAKGLIQAYPCKKIGVSVIGLEVPHAHIHLVPMNSISDMNFGKEKLNLSNDVLAESAQLIRSFLSE